MSTKKFRVGVLGATGMVGQRFLALLENHPWYEVTLVAASANSAGQKYADAVKGRWALRSRRPARVRGGSPSRTPPTWRRSPARSTSSSAPST